MQNPISFTIYFVAWIFSDFRVARNLKSTTRWCGKRARADSRKLDKQIVLLKKVIRLLTNLRILDSLRCIESRKLD